MLDTAWVYFRALIKPPGIASVHARPQRLVCHGMVVLQHLEKVC